MSACWFARPVAVASLVLLRPLAVVLLCLASTAVAETIELDLPTALARAHRAAPEAIAARGDIVRAEAEVAGAAVAFRENPELELGAGPRLQDGHPIDFEVRLAQPLDAGRRGARRAAARAGVARSNALAAATLRELDLVVTDAFADAVYAERIVELSRASEALTVRAVEAAERRRKAGDVTDLDVNLARVALGRARAALDAATSERAIAVGRVATWIGAAAEDRIELRGSLGDARGAADDARSNVRADVRAYAADAAYARAQLVEARTLARPALGVWASYQREEGTTILVGGLSIMLPVWNRAQGEKASARAAAQTASTLGAAAALRARREVADAQIAVVSARAAVERLERDVVPVLDDSEHLLERTIDAGQIAISDYLVARQELLAGRRELLDRRLALAKANAVLRFVTGGVR